MKKVMLSLLVVAGFGTALVSCKEEEPVQPKEAGTATVSGVAEADLETLGDTLDNGTYMQMLEPVPSGTMIYFTYDSGELDPDRDMGYSYDEITLSTTVGANGEYSIELPAVASGVDYTITFADFAHDQMIPDPNNGLPQTVTDRVIFTKGDETVTVHENSNIIRDWVYN